MMEINATLIIQIIHFWIAYTMLRVLLLKPAVALVQQEYMKNDELREDINHNYGLIDQKEKERSVQWQASHQKYIENKPSVEDPELHVFKQLSPAVEYPDIAKDIVDQLVDQSTKELVKRLSHDRH
ncbi:MAG: hypothetical protein Q8Q25_01080 [bacterium]|nr:hypothetical protein [bacterium]